MDKYRIQYHCYDPESGVSDLSVMEFRAEDQLHAVNQLLDAERFRVDWIDSVVPYVSV